MDACFGGLALFQGSYSQKWLYPAKVKSIAGIDGVGTGALSPWLPCKQVLCRANIAESTGPFPHKASFVELALACSIWSVQATSQAQAFSVLGFVSMMRHAQYTHFSYTWSDGTPI